MDDVHKIFSLVERLEKEGGTKIDLLLRDEALAKIYGVSGANAIRLMRHRGLTPPCVHIGRSVRTRLSDAVAHMRSLK